MSAVDVDDRRARVELSAAVEPGDPDLPRLVTEHGAQAVAARVRGWSGAGKLEGWSRRMADTDPGALLAAADRVGARFVCPGDAEWPAALDDLDGLDGAPRRSGPPLGLWVRGRLCPQPESVAVVGARHCTAYGQTVTEDLVTAAGAAGLSIVSGGAFGIDGRAHACSIQAGAHTVAVMAGGIDKLYPAGNARLLARVADAGAIVAEAPPGAAPTRSRFLVRNRLIAALSSGVVVVEAAWRSGALNTLRWGRALGRVAMAVPGSVLATSSGGTNQMLREPEVWAVTSGAELVEHVSPMGRNLASRPSGHASPRDGLTRTEELVLDAMPHSAAISLAEVARRSGQAPGVVPTALAALMGSGLVESHGESFRLTRGARAS